MQITTAPRATRGVSTLMTVGDTAPKKSVPWTLIVLIVGAVLLAK